jgi:hypothetical protein
LNNPLLIEEHGPDWDPFDDGKPKTELREIDYEKVRESRRESSAPLKPGEKRKKADHNLRTREFYERQGYVVFRVDQTRTSYVGSIFTVDFLGLFDWMAIKPDREVVGIQVTAYDAMGNHITKMCGSDETSFNKRRKCDNLRDWLKCGLLVHVIGWKQPGRHGSKWEPTVRLVTMETLAPYDARRRK